jgi:hypothetical protein
MKDKMTEYDLVISHEDGSRFIGVIATDQLERTIKEIASDGFVHKKNGQITFIPPRRIKLVTLMERTT